jgi:hypothetical protein
MDFSQRNRQSNLNDKIKRKQKLSNKILNKRERDKREKDIFQLLRCKNREIKKTLQTSLFVESEKV